MVSIVVEFIAKMTTLRPFRCEDMFHFSNVWVLILSKSFDIFRLASPEAKDCDCSGVLNLMRIMQKFNYTETKCDVILVSQTASNFISLFKFYRKKCLENWKLNCMLPKNSAYFWKFDCVSVYNLKSVGQILLKFV